MILRFYEYNALVLNINLLKHGSKILAHKVYTEVLDLDFFLASLSELKILYIHSTLKNSFSVSMKV